MYSYPRIKRLRFILALTTLLVNMFLTNIVVIYSGMKISKAKCDEWRYKYPELNTYQRYAKVPSQKLSDHLMQALFDEKKN